MRIVYIISLIACLLACQSNNSEKKLFDYSKMRNAVTSGIVLTHWETKPVYAYNEFCNLETKEVLSLLYHSLNEYLNYKITDSVDFIIKNRINHRIPNSFIANDIIKIVLISDTTKHKNFLMFSEPIVFDNNWMIFSISRRDSLSNIRSHYVFYLENSGGKNQNNIRFVYDCQKDVLLQRTVIK